MKDAMRFESEYYINIENGKGGRKRISPIVGKNIDQIVERMKNTPEDKKVWEYVNSNADIHSYRADYATEIIEVSNDIISYNLIKELKSGINKSN